MTYEYSCEACGHVWEAQQSISADPLTECPNCKKQTAKRMISGGQGFILKGGGWYADGYGAPSGKKSADSATPKEESAGKGASKVGADPPKTKEAATTEATPSPEAAKTPVGGGKAGSE